MTGIDNPHPPTGPQETGVANQRNGLLVAVFDNSFNEISEGLFGRSTLGRLRRRPLAGIIFQDDLKDEKYHMCRFWAGSKVVDTYLRALTITSDQDDHCWEFGTLPSTLETPSVTLDIYNNGNLQPDMTPGSELELYVNFVETIMSINSSVQQHPQNFTPLSCYKYH